MKIRLILSLIILCIGLGCSKSSTPAIPDCIQKKIDDAIAAYGNTPGNERFQISEYQYQGKNVFTISSGIPDAGIPIYDENCIQICLIGGFITTSTLFCNGEIFFDKAIKIRDLYTH